MKLVISFLIASIILIAQEKESNLNQYYSGKFGFFNPSEELNNGLIFGVDGITEFNNYNFFLSGAVDLYFKKTIDIFDDPKPRIEDQQIFILPIHVNAAYKIIDIKDADTKIYAGIGGGQYFYFYNIVYRKQSGGGILGGTSLTSTEEAKNGGDQFFTIFTRFLIGKIFIEPRYYIMGSESGKVDNSNYRFDPTGFSITFGFQY